MAKRLGVSPRALGADLAQALGGVKGIASASLAGAGFVNLRLEQDFITGVLGKAELFAQAAPGAARDLLGCA